MMSYASTGLGSAVVGQVPPNQGHIHRNLGQMHYEESEALLL